MQRRSTASLPRDHIQIHSEVQKQEKDFNYVPKKSNLLCYGGLVRGGWGLTRLSEEGRGKGEGRRKQVELLSHLHLSCISLTNVHF